MITSLGFDGSDPRAVLEWTFERFGNRVAISTAFGPSGIALTHMAAQVDPGVRAFFIDTGYNFRPTLDLIGRVRERLGVDIEVVHPDETLLLADDRADVTPLYERDPDRCCALRKVAPMRRVLRGLEAWMTALRRDQGASRAGTPVVESKLTDDGRVLCKISPFVRWSRNDVWRYVFEHALPYNPLHDRGYPSVGCWPCTQPAAQGADERAGRWVGRTKSECGLHTLI